METAALVSSLEADLVPQQLGVDSGACQTCTADVLHPSSGKVPMSKSKGTPLCLAVEHFRLGKDTWSIMIMQLRKRFPSQQHVDGSPTARNLHQHAHGRRQPSS